jgi:tetratricopeptide (TPR) repeat protein
MDGILAGEKNNLKDVVLTDIDFDAVENATSVRTIKRYLELLEEDGGYFVDLVNACKKKMLAISPKEYYKMFPPEASSAEIDEAIQDVLAWEDEVKAVDAALSKDKSDVIWETGPKKGRVPIRGDAPIQARHNVQAAPKKPAGASKDKARARDANTVGDYYRAWDKVDVDEMEQDLDADLLEEEALREEERQNAAQGDSTLGAVPLDIPAAQRPAVAQSEKEKGDEAFTAKDYKEAAEYYRRSNVVLAKPATHSNCALAFMKLKDFEAAIAECDRALRIEPRYMKAVHRRGKARYELGRYEDAVEDFQKAQAMAPNNATINADLMAARRQVEGLASSGLEEAGHRRHGHRKEGKLSARGHRGGGRVGGGGRRGHRGSLRVDRHRGPGERLQARGGGGGGLGRG